MTLAHDALSDLEALAYEAALEPSLWPQVVAYASHAFKAPYMMLGVADRGGKKVMHAAPPGLDELAEVAAFRFRDRPPGRDPRLYLLKRRMRGQLLGRQPRDLRQHETPRHCTPRQLRHRGSSW